MVNNLKKGIRSFTLKFPGAGNGVRTRDTKLGKLVLYQLSYARLTDIRAGILNTGYYKKPNLSARVLIGGIGIYY
jgi:hypothetical protein